MSFENRARPRENNEAYKDNKKNPWEWMSDKQLVEDQTQRIQKYAESQRYLEILSAELLMLSKDSNNTQELSISHTSRKIIRQRINNLDWRIHEIIIGDWASVSWFYSPINLQDTEDLYKLPENPLEERAIDVYTWNLQRKKILRELEEELVIYPESIEIQRKIREIKDDIRNNAIRPWEIVVFKPSGRKFTPIHEKAHQLMDWNAQMILSTKNYLTQLLSKNKKKALRMSDDTQMVNYTFSITELYANTITIKYLMDRFAIADPLKDVISYEDLQVLCKAVATLNEWAIKESAKHAIDPILEVIWISFDECLDDSRRLKKGSKHIVDKFFNWIAFNEMNKKNIEANV